MKGLQAGPLTFDFSGQARVRYEYDDGFAITGYEPGGHDQLLLERIRLEVSMRWSDGARLFLQLQDAHAFLTKLTAADFPQSNPIDDTLDVRQLSLEWLQIGGSPVGVRIGRQQISYGDQRVFGPGNWGNTGRYSWDAAMLKLDTDRVSTDLWVGKYLRYHGRPPLSHRRPPGRGPLVRRPPRRRGHGRAIRRVRFRLAAGLRCERQARRHGGDCVDATARRTVHLGLGRQGPE